MTHILEDFSKLSGQKVSTGKSKLFLSPNTTWGTAQLLSRRFDILQTQDLGKYLGLPLLRGRAGIKTFSFIVEKVKK